MYSYLLIAFAALVTYQLGYSLWQWRKNIQAAKASSLPYVAVPVFVFGTVWLILNRPVVKILRKIPKKYRPQWADKISSIHSWDDLWTNYEGNPIATYLTVSPKGCMLWTANAEAITQLTTRRVDFPKPGHMYRALNIYGKNLVAAEGQLWRRHRKITNPPFNEKNNHLVWTESLAQASYMVKSWTGDGGNESRTVNTVARDCMRLTLHIISRAGFGVRLLWPGVQTSVKTEDASKPGEMAATSLGEGHTMTYTEALETLLHKMIYVLALPRWLLRKYLL